MAHEDGQQMMWLDEEEDADAVSGKQPVIAASRAELGGGDAQQEADNVIAQLEAELQRSKKELQDVRKDLAAKTVQLSRKEVAVAHEKVAELAASVTGEKDRQLQQLAIQVEQLELTLATKEEELEESRRMYNAQKRALREALATAAEVEAAERQADEARAVTVAAEAVEAELERLQHELALLQARSELELRARDTELQALRQELMAANANRKEAVAAAEAALTEAWQDEVGRATAAAEGHIAELEQELARVRAQVEEQARSGDSVALAGELAALNQQKVAIQREFEAFKEMATAASRQNREDAAKMLEENATLKSRLAARAVQDMASGMKPQSKVFTALMPPGGAHGAHDPGAQPLMAGLLPPSWEAAASMPFPELLQRLEHQRRGLVPALVLAAVLVVFVLIAVVRAAAVTRSEHRGGLCFLAHLGITVGKGCGIVVRMQDKAGAELGALLEHAPRVHDVQLNVEEVAYASAGKAPSAGALRLLRRTLLGGYHEPRGIAVSDTAHGNRSAKVAVPLGRRLLGLGWGRRRGVAAEAVNDGTHGRRDEERRASDVLVVVRQSQKLAGSPG